MNPKKTRRCTCPGYNPKKKDSMTEEVDEEVEHSFISLS
jgi:hypothetical protein